MKEITYQKRRTKKYAAIIISCFENEDDKKQECEEKLDRQIEIQMNKHGWYKAKW